MSGLSELVAKQEVCIRSLQALVVRLWCGDIPDSSNASHRTYLWGLPEDERKELLNALDDPSYLEWVGREPGGEQ